MKTVLLLTFVLFALTPREVTFAEVYPGFKQVKPQDCVSLDITRIQSLPPSWHKYEKFIKICPVKRAERSNAVVSIVSVWTEDYLNTKAVKTWEEFPYSIIIDDESREVGTLPVIFPIDAPVEPDIYFGRWKGDLPTEVRVDVRDPTVSGDYYYPPLKWNSKDKMYHLTDKEPKSGSRPKR